AAIRPRATDLPMVRLVHAFPGAGTDGAPAHEMRRHRHIERLTDSSSSRAVHMAGHSGNGGVALRNICGVRRTVTLFRCHFSAPERSPLHERGYRIVMCLHD